MALGSQVYVLINVLCIQTHLRVFNKAYTYEAELFNEC